LTYLQFPEQENHVGDLKSLQKYNLKKRVNYLPMKYKYVIVMAGLENLAQSGRMNHLLAHSGAVILMQTTTFEYHYSARLKPWVHYVPISYNGADVISKIEWLRDHDEMAYQIAKNAKAFGDSYLRLEDYYCYIAAVQESLGNLYKAYDRTNVTGSISKSSNNTNRSIMEPFDLEKIDFTIKAHIF